MTTFIDNTDHHRGAARPDTRTGTSWVLDYERVERVTARVTLTNLATTPTDVTVVAEYARTPHVEAIPLPPVVNDAEVVQP